jgi:hypothetical protein
MLSSEQIQRRIRERARRLWIERGCPESDGREIQALAKLMVTLEAASLEPTESGETSAEQRRN